MQEPVSLAIPRTPGLIIHGVAVVMLLGGGGTLLWLAARQEAGPAFIRYLVLGLVVLLPLPFLAYRGVMLLQAAYLIDRDGLRLRWGVRSEDIPLDDIEWIRLAEDLVEPLPLPRLAFTGILRGTTEVEGLGKIEFMATDEERLVMVATTKVVFVISPADIDDFVTRYRESAEMGSLAPLKPASSYPDSLILRIWGDWVARFMVAGGAVLALALLVLVSVLIPTLDGAPLGFDLKGNPLPPSPPEFLLLLPLLGLVFFFADVVLGAFFYLRQGRRPLAYVLWGSSLVTPALLLGAVLTLVRSVN